MKNRYAISIWVYCLLATFSGTALFAQNSSASAWIPQSLNQLNSPYDGSGYPWISADGLRLYFTGGADHDSFFYTSRTARTQDFGTPVPLLLPAENDVLSPWLSADELEIWYVERMLDQDLPTTLTVARRASREEHFVDPQRVEVDITDGFISGPSLSRDGNQLFLYNAPDFGDNAIIQLKKVSETRFEVEKELTFGALKVAGSAQLSKDDLRLYVSLEDPSGQEHLYYTERKNVNAEFDTQNLKKLGKNINVDAPKTFQPTVTADETEIFFTRNPDGMWAGNKIWTAELNLEEVEEIKVDEIEEADPQDEYLSLDEFLVTDDWEELYGTERAVEEETMVQAEEILAETAPVQEEADALEIPEVSIVYPNPSSGIFNFEFKLPEGIQNPVLEVYSLEGVKQGSWPVEVASPTHTIDLTQLTAGTYLYRLVTDKGMSDTGKLILVR